MKENQFIGSFTEALEFAAYRHRFDKTKNEEPYINHVISVCNLLVSVGGITDTEVLVAAAIHDVIEKAGTKPSEINFQFGESIFQLVMEVTETKAASDAEKFELQLEKVPGLSARAKQIKLADKISNVKSILSYPPQGWDLERRSVYLEWSDKIIDALRGTNEKLEAYYDEIISVFRKEHLVNAHSGNAN